MNENFIESLGVKCDVYESHIFNKARKIIEEKRYSCDRYVFSFVLHTWE